LKLIFTDVMDHGQKKSRQTVNKDLVSPKKILTLSVNEQSLGTIKKSQKSKSLLRHQNESSLAKQSKRFSDLMTVSYESQLDAISSKLKHIEEKESLRRQIKRDPIAYFKREKQQHQRSMQAKVSFELPEITIKK
jgi:hypothetical protein